MEAELMERISNHNTEKEDLRNDIESYCSDTSVDLDIRWNLFVSSNLGKTHPDIINFDDIGLGSIYNDFSRHQVVDLIDVVENINAWVINYGSKPEEELQDFFKQYVGVYTKDVVIEMKERLMDKFVKACVHDW